MSSEASDQKAGTHPQTGPEGLSPVEGTNHNYSSDQSLNILLTKVVTSVKGYSDQLAKRIKELSKIGIALSAEKNLPKLLEMIVDEARRFTNADAGTLYLLKEDQLHFEIMQNDTMGTRMGGTSGNPITLPPVKMNKQNVSAYVALSGQIINIADVYEAEGFDFTGPRKYDAATGYRSQSMLVVPMRNHESEIIGVLQLLNAKDLIDNHVIPFSAQFEDLTASLASQAAVAITNVRLIEEMEVLFESFVQTMAVGIESKSPVTAGHITRVAGLMVKLCEEINDTHEGKFKDVHFTPEQINEIRIASFMHDLGKITTPERIIDKANKLDAIVDRVIIIRNRYNLIIRDTQIAWLNRKVEMVRNREPEEKIQKEEELVLAALTGLGEEMMFVLACNNPGEFMEQAKIDRLKAIAQKRYWFDGQEYPYLTEDEVHNLSIRKGSITEAERQIMQDHIVITINMLKQIPFTKKLRNVPLYAGQHHEKLNGTGYPYGLKGDQIPLPSRMMALVDFYEALTAKDRPYKKPMPLEKALGILGSEVKDNAIDADLFELFVTKKVYEKYEEEYQRLKEQQTPDQNWIQNN